MTKLAKQYWINAKGEKKISCYKATIIKEVLEKTDIKEYDEVKIYVKDNKIIIEKA